MNEKQIDICVIGGGAAGFFAAIHAKEANPTARVVIIEQRSEVLAKVKISGGGRCNVTHACFDVNQLCDHYPRGSKSLKGPFHVFQPSDTIEWFQKRGVTLKTEPDNRMFPTSDSSQTIIDCLLNSATSLGIKLWTKCTVKTIRYSKQADPSNRFQIQLADTQELVCQRLILATGSNKSAYQFAKDLGHTITDLVPSLFTFKVPDSLLHDLSGLSVQEASVWISGQPKTNQTGPILITHWGFSGPAIIRLSAWQARQLHERHYQCQLNINWLSTLSESRIRDRLFNQKTTHPMQQLGTKSLFQQLPSRLWAYLVNRSGASIHSIWQQLSKKQINKLVNELSNGVYDMTGKGVFKEEFVTCGGVVSNEIDFKTMQSKVCPELYVVGELLDVDGITGGFNFQNAWTTGYIAGSQSLS